MVRIPVGEMMRALYRPDLPRLEVYGDESLKRGNFDLLGALWVRPEEARALRADIAAIRSSVRCPAANDELKWTRCSGDREKPTFSEVVDLVMDRICAGQIEYKCIVVDRRLVDNERWNAGDKELGYYKAWHTLLYSRIENGYGYRVYLDARQLQAQARLSDLRDVLNARGIRDLGLSYRCCDLVEGRDSKKEELIQVADLLTGAVGYHYCNGGREPNASPAKIALAARIARHLGRQSLAFASKPWERRFNVWRWRPKNPRG